MTSGGTPDENMGEERRELGRSTVDYSKATGWRPLHDFLWRRYERGGRSRRKR